MPDSPAPTALGDLDTPAALIDEARMARNIGRMQARMDALGVAFRPHVKTSKSVPVAQRQRAAGARGITVSTLKEAEQFFEAGFDDILYAVALSPDKAARALALQRRGCRLQVVLDSVETARALALAAGQAGQSLPVLIEIDVDGHRSGLQPDGDALIAVGRAVHEGGLELAGVMTHAGGSYGCDTPEALQAFAEQERRLTVRAAERLRAAGLPCERVSVGSTPTALSAQDLQGVTEVRAGVYVFFDLVMAGVGVCATDDIALSVLTTVIGHQADRGWVIVDAGWMAMSRDRGTQSQRVDCGYGLVCDAQGEAIAGLRMSSANQEHGILAFDEPAQGADLAARFPVGTRLRVLPNHACATAAQHGGYHLVRDGAVTASWDRFSGW